MIYQVRFDETRFQSIFPYYHDYPPSERERDYARRWNAIISGTATRRRLGDLAGPDPDSGCEAVAKLVEEHPGKLTLCEPPRAASEIMSVFCSYTVLALTERLRNFPDFLVHFEKEGVLFPYPCEIPITRLTNWLSNPETLARWPEVSRVGEQPVTLDWDGPFHLADPRVLEGLKVSLFFCNNWIHGLVDCELSDGGWQVWPNNSIRYYSFDEKPVFKQSPPPGTWLFRVPENPIKLFCTGEFKESYEHHAFKGMVFKPMIPSSDPTSSQPVKFLVTILATLTAIALSVTARSETNNPPTTGNPAPKPNIVIILADDLGVECLSTYGGTSLKTPNIDRLATQGMRFTRCFSNPYCSPSRASLLTGRYPFKNGLTTVLDTKAKEDVYLHLDQPSFARQLKQAGYATGLVGKWHLSLEHKHNTITGFGFDHYQTWRIFDDNGEKTTRYWTPYLIRDGTVIADQIKDRYGPDVDLGFFLEFIKSNAAKNQPFLAYYATCLPHFPWEPTPDSENNDYRQPHTGHKGDPKYFPDMVAYLDKHVGRIMQTLEEQGITDNTIVIFLADNGTDRGLTTTWGDAKRIRGGKGTLTDRGTHVPLIVRWPGRIKSGSICDDLIDFSDLCPTLCEMAGAAMPREEIHGRNFSPQLLGKAGHPRDWVHIQHEGNRQVRNSHYMLNNQGELRRVVELWQEPAMPNENKDPEQEAAERKSLQAVFDALRQ